MVSSVLFHVIVSSAMSKEIVTKVRGESQIENSVPNVDLTFKGRVYIVATSRFKRVKSSRFI